MDTKECLKCELNRLNKLNDKLEERFNQGYRDNEHELIIKNTLAMCEIAKILF